MNKKQFTTKEITKIAIMAALVFIATYSFKVPSLHGYTHLGDCMIFISVLILGGKKGGIAGGIGASLADLIGGYMIWIVPTFFIKFIMAFIMGLLIEKFLLKQMDEYEIEKVILCGTGSHDNENVANAYTKYKERVLPIVYTNPCEGKDAVEKIYNYVNRKNFRGIKLNPLKDAYVADSEILDPIMEAAEELNIPVFIHCGHPPYSLPWSIALLAERFPNVKVVMIHMGHGHGVYIDASLKMARRYNNLYLEMSGMPMESKIREAYETVGSDRIFFGTDAPFHHPSIEIQKVLTCGLEESALEDIFYNNINKLFQ